MAPDYGGEGACALRHDEVGGNTAAFWTRVRDVVQRDVASSLDADFFEIEVCLVAVVKRRSRSASCATKGEAPINRMKMIVSLIV
jgi:hypothetical protein